MTKKYTPGRQFLLTFMSSLLVSLSYASNTDAVVFSETLRDTVTESKDYFLNGAVKNCTRSYYDKQGTAYKTIVEYYRKDGSRRSTTVLNYGIRPLYRARYAKNDAVIIEKYYTYNFNSVLIQVETKKNGQSQFQVFGTDAQGNAVG